MKEKNRNKGKEKGKRVYAWERKRRNDAERGENSTHGCGGPSAPSDGVALLKDEGKFTARVGKGENLLLVVGTLVYGPAYTEPPKVKLRRKSNNDDPRTRRETAPFAVCE